jgi:hypothetical protein
MEYTISIYEFEVLEGSTVFLESTTESHTFAITITGSKSSSLLCHIFVNSLISYAG